MAKYLSAAIYFIATLACSGLTSENSLAQSAQVNWGPWNFRWEVADGAGIGLRDLKFDGRTLMHRGNLPVIRVKYAKDGGSGGCGPYADRISWSNLTTDNNCQNGQKVCQRTFSWGGRDWLEISGRAFIGSYDITQVWYLTRDGELQPRLFSRGLQCRIDHTHHAYWQFDFDVDGAAGDEIFLHSPSFGNTGYGPGWFRYSNEFDSRRNPSERPTWFVRDAQTLRGVFVNPSVTDGPNDSFSRINAGIRLYHGNEAGPWQFGASGELGYNNSENVVSRDDVLWYIGHLFHASAEGPNQFHAVGPILRINR